MCEFIVERPCCWEGECRPQTLWGPVTIRIILGTSALLPEVVTYPLAPDVPPPEHSAEEEGLGTCSSGTDEFGLSVAQPTWAPFPEMESEGWGGVGTKLSPVIHYRQG